MIINLTKAFRVVVLKTDNHIKYKTISNNGDLGSRTSYSSDIYNGYQFDTQNELETFINNNNFIEEPEPVEPEPPVEPPVI